MKSLSRITIALLLVTISLACSRKTNDALASWNLIDETPYMQQGFYDTIQYSNYPIYPKSRVNIAPNSLRICRWNGSKVVPYWVTPVFIPSHLEGQICFTISDVNGVILNTAILDAPAAITNQLSIGELQLAETTTGEMVCKWEGSYYKVGHNSTLPSSEKMYFYRTEPGQERYFPEGQYLNHIRYYSGIYLASYENDIATVYELCSKNTELKDGYRVYIDFSGMPLLQSDFIMSTGSATLRIRGQKVDTVFAYRVDPPRGVDADIPELHPHVRRLIKNEGEDLLYEYSKGPDNETYREARALLKPSTLTTVWKTIQWMGYDTFLTSETFAKRKFCIKDGLSLTTYGHSIKYSYQDLLVRLITSYELKSDTIPYFNHFWERRKEEGNSELIYEIMVDVVNYYNSEPFPSTSDTIPSYVSEELVKCIQFEQALHSNREPCDSIRSLYVDYLIEIEMYASASLIARDRPRFGSSDITSECVSKTTGPHFSTRIEWNKEKPWAAKRRYNYYILSFQRGP